jgi:hypothetical protein
VAPNEPLAPVLFGPESMLGISVAPECVFARW